MEGEHSRDGAVQPTGMQRECLQMGIQCRTDVQVLIIVSKAGIKENIAKNPT